MISNDVNLINIVSTINKLKASVSVIIGDDKELFKKIEQKYFES